MSELHCYAIQWKLALRSPSCESRNRPWRLWIKITKSKVWVSNVLTVVTRLDEDAILSIAKLKGEAVACRVIVSGFKTLVEGAAGCGRENRNTAGRLRAAYNLERHSIVGASE